MWIFWHFLLPKQKNPVLSGPDIWSRTLEKTEAELTAEEDEIDFKKISSTIKNHFFYSQSATLYGGSG